MRMPFPTCFIHDSYIISRVFALKMVDLAPIAVRKSLLFLGPLVHVFISNANQNGALHEKYKLRNLVYLCKCNIGTKLICKYISPYQSFQ